MCGGVVVPLTGSGTRTRCRRLHYDDDVQIVQNDYIKHDRYLWHVLTSDVWKFRTPEGGAQSNYWRPSFVAWLAMNYRLFKLNTTGWHVLGILAHLLVTLLSYQVLVALRLKMEVVATVTWAFAAHPVHVQSVTWISGVPDVLMGGFLLGSFLCYLRVRERQRWYLWASSLLLYFAALLSRNSSDLSGDHISHHMDSDRENRLAIAGRSTTHSEFPSVPSVAVVFWRALAVLQMSVLRPRAGLDAFVALPSYWFSTLASLLSFMLGPFHPLRPLLGPYGIQFPCTRLDWHGLPGLCLFRRKGLQHVWSGF